MVVFYLEISYAKLSTRLIANWMTSLIWMTIDIIFCNLYSSIGMYVNCSKDDFLVNTLVKKPRLCILNCFLMPFLFI